MDIMNRIGIEVIYRVSKPLSKKYKLRLIPMSIIYGVLGQLVGRFFRVLFAEDQERQDSHVMGLYEELY